MRSIFMARGPYLGVNESTRRALGQMDLDNEYVERIIGAVKRLGLKPASPCYMEDVAAHVGIPSLKISFFMRHVLETAAVTEARKKWGRHGWISIPISHRQMEPLTDEQLSDQLHVALKSMGKLK